MWYRKANRIADLEARLAVALRSREPIDDGSRDTIRALRHDLTDTKTALGQTEKQLGESRRHVATLIDQLADARRQLAARPASGSAELRDARRARLLAETARRSLAEQLAVVQAANDAMCRDRVTAAGSLDRQEVAS